MIEDKAYTSQVVHQSKKIIYWLKRHSNYSASHENYEPYIDQKHLILLGQYNGNYYVQDVASLDAFGGVLS